MRLFADTFYFIALLDASDAHHAVAVERLRGREAVVVTTRWVLAEVADALSAPIMRRRAATFIEQLQRHPNFVVCEESDELFVSGLALYSARPDKAWSLTDCISFVVMEKEGVRQALTGDRHFSQAGFEAIFAE